MARAKRAKKVEAPQVNIGAEIFDSLSKWLFCFHKNYFINKWYSCNDFTPPSRRNFVAYQELQSNSCASGSGNFIFHPNTFFTFQ